MIVSIFKHQQDALEKLQNGMILVGGVGSGKSRVGLHYYYSHEYPKNLYIITTAKKRDKKEWEEEMRPFGITAKIDSWNNLKKYINVEEAFFLLDEQRLVGNGTWTRSFLKIVKKNNWILLSATPGDQWKDYIPVFIANGFFKNRTEFFEQHVLMDYRSKYPKIRQYMGVGKLVRLRDSITVHMRYQKKTIIHDYDIMVPFDQDLFDTAFYKRWHPYENRPIQDIQECCYLMRRVVNSDPRRIGYLKMLMEKHPRIIVFYSFNYERELLLELGNETNTTTAEWSGHRHQEIPNGSSWLYLVQYSAGGEGWNCIDTDTIVFYSQSYSYRSMIQAAGRIDRLNTPFTDLHYYYFRSKSAIDIAIQKALRNKKNFNESRFLHI